MLFNSYLFLLVFLPVTLLGYYLLSARAMRFGTVWLLVMSLVFYGYYNPWYLLLISGSIVVNYGFSRGLQGNKALLTLAIAANVALIFYFKYYDFFITNINTVFRTDFALRHVLLPLGISFFTFQQISFVVDAYRGQTGDYGFLDYAVFVTFFPQLVAGPIVLHGELIPQIKDRALRVFDFGDLAYGLQRFTVGLTKKVLLADFFAPAVAYAYTDGVTMNGAMTLLAMLAYSLQLYFDFSGYSDMAVGLARMFRFRIPENFHMPYRAATILETWEKWHMTLGRFLRQYVYYPLGGSRKGEACAIFNTMVVFLVSGIWHGANHTFVLWGLINGAACCAARVLMRGRAKRAVGALRQAQGPQERAAGEHVEPPARSLHGWRRGVGIFCTFLFWVIAVGLFRANTVTQWTEMMGRILTPSAFLAGGVAEDFASLLRVPGLRRLLSFAGIGYTDMGVYIFSMIVVFAAGLVLTMYPKPASKWNYAPRLRNMVITAVVLSLCVLSLSRVSVFLYFNF